MVQVVADGGELLQCLLQKRWQQFIWYRPQAPGYFVVRWPRKIFSVRPQTMDRYLEPRTKDRTYRDGTSRPRDQVSAFSCGRVAQNTNYHHPPRNLRGKGSRFSSIGPVWTAPPTPLPFPHLGDFGVSGSIPSHFVHHTANTLLSAVPLIPAEIMSVWEKRQGAGNWSSTYVPLHCSLLKTRIKWNQKLLTFDPVLSHITRNSNIYEKP